MCRLRTYSTTFLNNGNVFTPEPAIRYDHTIPNRVNASFL